MNNYDFNNSLYGCFRNRKFSQIFTNKDDFVNQVVSSELDIEVNVKNLTRLYYLLYGKYGNSTIASSDETQFKYHLFSIIFEYGPTWEKRLEIQKSVRNMDESELLNAGVIVSNSADNPSSEPSTATLEELTYIDSQATSKTKRGKLESFALLKEVLDTDVTESFLNRFKVLFLTIIQPEKPLYYEEENE